MKVYSQTSNYILYEGDMLKMLENIKPDSIDSIVTDPPYELNFMGKGWDNAGVSFQKETWEKCFDVLKPGGYLLAFGGSRTFHRIACAIEDAGFEIRDTIMWIYGSGFPKSLNIANSIEGRIKIGSGNTKDYKRLDGIRGKSALGYNKANLDFGYRPNNYDGIDTTIKVNITTDEAKRWVGWGTALKPSFEPIIVARKPCEGSCIDNVLKYGVGGINIDECRVETNEQLQGTTSKPAKYGGSSYLESKTKNNGEEQNPNGRYPANTILTYDETDFDEVCGGFPNTKSSGGSMTMPDLRDVGKKSKESIGIDKLSFGQVSNAERKETSYTAPSDEGSASRYFYCAKASKRDRDEGLDEFETKQCVGGGGGIGNYLNDVNSASGKFGSEKAPHKNIHPTVKPTTLMQYLVRLVTPKGGTILDPFNGSGSTGKAVMYENLEHAKGYKYIGIELTKEYLPISKARIDYAITGFVNSDLGEDDTELKSAGNNGYIEEQLCMF